MPRVTHSTQGANARVKSGSISPVQTSTSVASAFTSAMSTLPVSICQAPMIVNVTLALRVTVDNIATRHAAFSASMEIALALQTTSASAIWAGLGATVVKIVAAMSTAVVPGESVSVTSANTSPQGSTAKVVKKGVLGTQERRRASLVSAMGTPRHVILFQVGAIVNISPRDTTVNSARRAFMEIQGTMGLACSPALARLSSVI